MNKAGLVASGTKVSSSEAKVDDIRSEEQLLKLRKRFQRDLKSVMDGEVRKAKEESRLHAKLTKHSLRIEQMEDERKLIRQASSKGKLREAEAVGRNQASALNLVLEERQTTTTAYKSQMDPTMMMAKPDIDPSLNLSFEATTASQQHRHL